MPVPPPTHGTSRVGPSGKVLVIDTPGGAAVTGFVEGNVQRVTATSEGGTFTLTFVGQTTAALKYGATPAEVQAALEALSSIGSGNVEVTGVGPYRVRFVGTMGGATQPAITANASGLIAVRPDPPAYSPGSGASSEINAVSGGVLVTRVGTWTQDASELYRAVAGTGLASMTWKVTVPSAGYYRVVANWPGVNAGDFEYASNAPWRVYNGDITLADGSATLIETAYADQRDPSYGEVFVSSGVHQPTTGLASVYLSGTVCTVVLADDADGVVCGDTVKLVPFNPTLTRAAEGYGLQNGLAYAGTWLLEGTQGGFGRFGATFRKASGSGSGKFRWYFGAVFPGSYDVYAFWPDLTGSLPATYATNAPFSVLDGLTTQVGSTVRVNQTALPTNNLTVTNEGTDLDAATKNFQLLGRFTVAGTELVVELSDDANGYVVADAIAIVPVTTTPSRVVTPGVAVTTLFVGGPPTYKVDGGAAVELPGSAAIWTRDRNAQGVSTQYTTYVAWALDDAIAPGASVTITYQDSVIQTDAGALLGVTDQAVDVSAIGGSFLSQAVPLSRPMKVGSNLTFPDQSRCTLANVDLVKESGAWSCTADPTLPINGPTYCDTDGYLLDAHADTLQLRGATGGIPGGRGYPNKPNGVYTLKFDGTGTVDITDRGNLSAVRLTGTSSSHTQTWQLEEADPDGGYWGANLTVTGRATNIRLYEPGAATDGSQRFTPEFLAQLAGNVILRPMEMVNTNGSQVIDFSDYVVTSDRTYGNPTWHSHKVAITAIDPYARTGNASGTAFTPDMAPLLVTTATPHGFKVGLSVNLQGPGAEPFYADPAEGSGLNLVMSGGPPLLITLDNLPVRAVISSTQFVVAFGAAGTTLTTPVVITEAWATARPAAGSPLADAVALVNAVPGCAFWATTGHAATDACVASFYDYVFANLEDGRHVYLELSNECWNPYFIQFGWFEQMAVQWGLAASNGGGGYAYAVRSAQVHEIALARYAASGRTGGVTRVIGSQYSFAGGPTQAITTFAAAHDSQGRASTDPAYTGPIPIDTLSLGAYVNAGPGFQSELFDVYDSLDIEQTMDLVELSLLSDTPGGPLAGHRSYLDGNGYTATTISAYEGAISFTAFGWNDTDPAKALATRRAQGSIHHPRFYGIQAEQLRSLQAAGCVAYCHYALNYGPAGGAPVVIYGFLWNTFWSWSMTAGRGDGSDGKYDNSADLGTSVPVGVVDLTQAVSPLALAITDWNEAPPAAPARHRFRRRRRR